MPGPYTAQAYVTDFEMPSQVHELVLAVKQNGAEYLYNNPSAYTTPFWDATKNPQRVIADSMCKLCLEQTETSVLEFALQLIKNNPDFVDKSPIADLIEVLNKHAPSFQKAYEDYEEKAVLASFLDDAILCGDYGSVKLWGQSDLLSILSQAIDSIKQQLIEMSCFSLISPCSPHP